MRLVWHTNVISPNLLTKIAHFAKQFRPICFSISPNLHGNLAEITEIRCMKQGFARYVSIKKCYFHTLL